MKVENDFKNRSLKIELSWQEADELIMTLENDIICDSNHDTHVNRKKLLKGLKENVFQMPDQKEETNVRPGKVQVPDDILMKLPKEMAINAMYEAISLMQQSNTRSVEYCIGIALGGEPNEDNDRAILPSFAKIKEHLS